MCDRDPWRVDAGQGSRSRPESRRTATHDVVEPGGAAQVVRPDLQAERPVAAADSTCQRVTGPHRSGRGDPARFAASCRAGTCGRSVSAISADSILLRMPCRGVPPVNRTTLFCGLTAAAERVHGVVERARLLVLVQDQVGAEGPSTTSCCARGRTPWWRRAAGRGMPPASPSWSAPAPSLAPAAPAWGRPAGPGDRPIDQGSVRPGNPMNVDVEVETLIRPRGHHRSSSAFGSDAVSDPLNARSRRSASSSTLPPRRACLIAR